MYSAPTKSSLNAKKEASQMGIVCLLVGTKVLIPSAAWILAIKSRYVLELYLTSQPASLISSLFGYFSFILIEKIPLT